ncbi:MAG TPA: hypothetical protein VEY92_07635 [Pseudoxanthomonas sp.]|nr:hypothetical protein [Pseudoxanthomonas sp.]
MSRLTVLLGLSLGAASALAAASGAPPPALDAASVDLPALIECRAELSRFFALGPALADPLQAVALGWRPLPQANMFLTEFKLTAPITVFGHASDHIAFAGNSILAILDLPDPRPLAKELALETAIDTPAKAMFGKELRSLERRDPGTGQALIESLVLNVSNVHSHPGKTLVGCSYTLDPDEPDPDEETPGVHPEDKSRR